MIAPAAWAAPGVAELIETTDVSGLSVSPDGTRLAFRTETPSIQSNSVSLEWQIADLGTGRVRRVSGGGDAIYADPGLLQEELSFWSRDSRFIYYRALVDGAVGLWRTAADGSGSRPVALPDADIEQPERSPDGAALLYRTGPTRDEIERAERREYDQGILVDRHVDLAQPLYRGGSINGRMATQRLIGRWYERAGLLWQAPRTEHRLDLETLQVSDLGPVPPPEIGSGAARLDFDISAQAANGALALAGWDGRSSKLRVARSGREPIFCAADVCRGVRIVALLWRPGHDEVLYTVQDRHQRQALYLWNVLTGHVTLVARGEGLLSGSRTYNVPCAVSADDAFCVSASAVSPPRLERIALDTGLRSVVSDPNARLREQAMPRAEHLSWQLPDGRTATGVLLLPSSGSAAPLPLFVNHYRCPGYLRGGEGDEWPFPALVDAGIAVACVNATPAHAPQDALADYRTALASVSALVDLLVSRGVVDRARVGMGGLSAGSEATMWIATHSNLLAAISIASPQLEPAVYWLNAVRGRDQPAAYRQVWGLGAPDETPARWAEVSMASNVNRIRAPLLMQLPEQEARFAIEFYARITNSTTPVEMYAFPDEAHVKIQPRHRFAVNRRNLDWFRYWLQGYRDADPALADQYRRWEELARRSESAAP